MADFAVRRATAAPALGWEAADFLDAYSRNRAPGLLSGIAASPVAQTILALRGSRQCWEGAASELLVALDERDVEQVPRCEDWPKSAHGLAGELRRLVPGPMVQWLSVTFVPGRRRGRAVDEGRTLLPNTKRTPGTPKTLLSTLPLVAPATGCAAVLGD